MSHLDNQRDYKKAVEAAVKARKKYLSAALEYEAKTYIEQIGGCEDHEAYRNAVVPYWEKFGYVPEEFWFSIGGSRDNVMNPHFIPLDLLYTEIIPYLNNMQMDDLLSDKSSYEIWFPDAKQAKTICHRVAGVFYDDKMNIISEEDALRLCMDSDCVLFIKPSTGAAGGRGINVADARMINTDELKKLFDKTGMNFVVQEEIRQHPQLKLLNPDATATIRVTSLFMDGEVHILSETMRVCPPGHKIPLGASGGYYTQILKDGSLCEKLLYVTSETTENDGNRLSLKWGNAKEDGLFDEDYRVPMIDKVKALAVKLHSRLARFRFIGWDFTVDEEGDPLLIELNTSPGRIAGQIAICSPMFGDMTDRVLEDFFIERSLENVQPQGLLVQ